MRQHQHLEEDRIMDPQAAEPGYQPNAALAGAEFLAAADEAIARVLSGDAESFLRENRQQGGE